MSLNIMGPSLVLGLIGGAALAALHLWLLWRATRRLGAGDSGLGLLLGGGALRLAVLVAGFAGLGALAAQPAAAMLAGLLGFTLLRSLTVRRLRQSRPASKPGEV